MTSEALEPPIALPGRAVPIAATVRRFLPIASIVGLFVLWEALARSGSFNAYLLPPVSVVLERVFSDIITGEFFINTGLTLYRAIAGFSIAAFLGVVIGVSMARVRLVQWFFDPIISVGFPMPKVAFLPIFMLWLGAYDASKITLVAFACFFAITANTVAGTQGVDRHLIWSARSLGASERKILWSVILPAALPQILTGFQIAMPLGMIVTIVSEMLMGGIGLGGTIIKAQRFAESVGVFAGIIEIGFAGFLVIYGLRLLRRYLLAWHQEGQR
jgi:taurine transport system permease protein